MQGLKLGGSAGCRCPHCFEATLGNPHLNCDFSARNEGSSGI
jgi:hypothetical protein